MIIATVYALWAIFGGAGLDLYSLKYLQPKIEQVVVAEDRQDALIKLIKAQEDKQDDFNKQAADAGKKMLEINKNYAASKDEFHAVVDAADQRLLEMQNRYIDLRFALKEDMTREEWKAVFAPE